MVTIQAHAKGLEVVALIDPSLPDLVRGDAGRLRQILLNLGGNAVKFTHKGEVAIECKVVQKHERGVTIRCEVRDTGMGIPADPHRCAVQERLRAGRCLDHTPDPAVPDWAFPSSSGWSS